MEHKHELAVAEHVPATSSGEDQIVVLVHGSLDRSTSFARVIRRLADLHVVVYDRRGYHRSRSVMPLATTLEDHADDLLQVIGGRRAVVVGHSYGGDVALAAACRGLMGIVAVAAYEPPLPWLPSWDSGREDSPRTQLEGDPARVAESFFRRVVGPGAWERLPTRTQTERRADGPALMAELRAIRTGSPLFDLSELTVPALFGRGERSLPRQRDGAAWLAGHVAGSVLVDIAGAAHGAHLTHPDAFASLVRQTVALSPSSIGRP